MQINRHAPSNGKYTWSNKRIGKNNIKERLDRFIIQDKFANAFSEIKSKIIHNVASNHKPVALTLRKLENLGPIPFIFSSTWNDNEEVKKITVEVSTKSITGSPNYFLETKLKALRRELKH